MHAGMLCACLGLIYAINLSRPGLLDWAGQIKGTDFVHFYVLGSVAVNGPVHALYETRTLADISAALVPESKGVYYLPIYGPQVALFFAPLSTLPYAWALAAWVLITASVYGLCCASIWKVCPALRTERSTIILLAAACPAFFNLLAHGQNSAIALACLTGAFFALRHRQHLLAGLAIGTLVYKPQLGLVMACVFGLSLDWRVVVGAVAGAAAQLGLAWFYFGTDIMHAYWNALSGISGIQPLLDIKPYQMHSLFSFWNLLLPWPNFASAAYVVSAALVIVTAWRVWRTRAPLSLRYAFLLLATVLVSPHLNVYDLVILAPALLMVGDWALGHSEDPRAKPVQRLLYYSYALPLAGAVAQFTHIQASVVAMSALSWMLASIALRYQETRLATSQVYRREPV
jgi:alpha-1,2-mannosyltransferase